MTTHRMPALPPMPGRKGAPRPCACGCGAVTRGGTWWPGHDGRATGWAARIAKGLITIDDVPANERAGARIMLARRAADEARDPLKATA